MSPRGPVVVLLGLTFLLLPFQMAVEIPFQGTSWRGLRTAADLPTALLAVAVLLSLAHGARSRALRPLALYLPILALMVVSLAFHPSGDGAALVLNFAEAVAIASGFALVAPAERTLLIAVFVGATAFQVILAAAQIANGAPLHLIGIGELQDPLFVVGTSFAPRGTMSHPYLLAGIALIGAGAAVAAFLVSSRPIAWLISVAVAISPVGVTYSRTALLALLAGSATLLPNARRSLRHRAAVMALAAGFLIPAAIESGGWLTRAESSLEHGIDRPVLIAQGLRVIADAPLLGHGPGQYYVALADLERRAPGSVTVDQVPHSVPVLLAADAGILAGSLMLGSLAMLGWRAFGAGPVALTAFLLFLPFILNDHFPYSTAQGALLFGTWSGMVAGLAEKRE